MPSPRPAGPLRRVSTGSRSFDSMMEGGTAFGRFTEFSGEEGTGKSQLLFTLAVLFPRGSGRVFFVDTGGTFRPERLHQIAVLRGIEPDAVLGNVDVLEPRSPEKMAEGVVAALASGSYAGVLVDTLSELFYGAGALSRETARLSLLCRSLAYHALANGTLVAAANGVRYNPESNLTHAQGFEHTAAYIHTRISLRRNAGRWLAVDSGTNARAEFAVGPAGIVDI